MTTCCLGIYKDFNLCITVRHTFFPGSLLVWSNTFTIFRMEDTIVKVTLYDRFIYLPPFHSYTNTEIYIGPASQATVHIGQHEVRRPHHWWAYSRTSLHILQNSLFLYLFLTWRPGVCAAVYPPVAVCDLASLSSPLISEVQSWGRHERGGPSLHCWKI